MFHDISPAMAGLLGTWCSTLLYGIASVVYVACIYVLIKRRRERARSATWILIFTATLQFLLSTAYVAVGLRSLIDGFILALDTPGGPKEFWLNLTGPIGIAPKALYITNSIVGDSILVWRSYIIWGRNKYVCFLPIVLICGTAASGYAVIIKLATLSLNNLSGLNAVSNWLLSFLTLSISNQVISTLAIAGRIWWHSRSYPQSKSHYISTIAIIVESGALYTLTTLSVLIFFIMRTEVGGLLSDILSPITTIAPTLIILRVELTRNRGTTLGNNTELSFRAQPRERLETTTIELTDASVTSSLKGQMAWGSMSA